MLLCDRHILAPQQLSYGLGVSILCLIIYSTSGMKKFVVCEAIQSVVRTASGNMSKPHQH